MTDAAYSSPAVEQTTQAAPRYRAAALAPWLLLGIGLGGLVDGIVFNQILQWHNMLSNAVPPTDLDRIRFNVFADGLFHGTAWLVTLLGLFLLWRSVRRGRSNRFSAGAFGGLLAGFGLFNLVEGLVSHHLLQLHNVREVVDPEPWNLGFLLLLGVLPLALGSLLRQRAAQGPPVGPLSRELLAANESTSAGPRRAHLVQILLPLTTNEGHPIDPRTFEVVKDELTQRYGGLTAYTRSPGEGRWRGERAADDVVVFEVMCSELDRYWWNAYRRRLEAEFRQQSVVIRAEPMLLL